MGRKAKSRAPRPSTADPAKPKNAPPPPPKIHRIGGPGRPRGEIDWDQFEALCNMHCTKLEICGWFSITDKTLEDRVRERYGRVFSEIHAELAGEQRASLRRLVWQAALGGSLKTATYLYGKHCEPPAARAPAGPPGGDGSGGAGAAPIPPNQALLDEVLNQLRSMEKRPPEDLED